MFWKWISVSAVLFLVVGAVYMKVVGLDWVEGVLLPGDPAVTAAALDEMVDNLRHGFTLAEAFEEFCRDIVNNAIPLS